MIINGLVGESIATMSFNEHHYIVRSMSKVYFSTLYYLGLDPIFGNYIEENDTLVVSGKLTKRDLLEKEATVYSGVTITKDKEYINIDDITDNTKYLKNIDAKTGECFSRIYVEGDIKAIKLDLYSYRDNDSIVLVTPNLRKGSFNVFDLKKELINVLTDFDTKELQDSLRVVSVIEHINDNINNNYFEAIIEFGEFDNIHVPFILDDNKQFKFFSFVYSEHFTDGCKLKDDNTLISSYSFAYYFSKSDLVSKLYHLMNKNKETKKEDKRLAMVYIRNKIGNYSVNK